MQWNCQRTGSPYAYILECAYTEVLYFRGLRGNEYVRVSGWNFGAESSIATVDWDGVRLEKSYSRFQLRLNVCVLRILFRNDIHRKIKAK